MSASRFDGTLNEDSHHRELWRHSSLRIGDTERVGVRDVELLKRRGGRAIRWGRAGDLVVRNICDRSTISQSRASRDQGQVRDRKKLASAGAITLRVVRTADRAFDSGRLLDLVPELSLNVFAFVERDGGCETMTQFSLRSGETLEALLCRSGCEYYGSAGTR